MFYFMPAFFFFVLLAPPLTELYLLPPATCAADLRVTRADGPDSRPRPRPPRCCGSPDRVSWPGSTLVSNNLLSAPQRQIGSICVSDAVPNTNTVHLLILIHPPPIHVRGRDNAFVYRIARNKLLRKAITSCLKGTPQTGLIDAIAVVIKPFSVPPPTPRIAR